MTLGNFLSGMETWHDLEEERRAIALETSLVEWKHMLLELYYTPPSALETSLVEWKPDMHAPRGLCFHTLETSLVEWKPLVNGERREVAGDLGNFLSGMETFPAKHSFAGSFPPWKLP